MPDASIGVVVIGRNEGERLRACLSSLGDVAARVYVDSGSTDGSCAIARGLGFEVVELAIPPGFTAARARNAGIARLVKRHSDIAFVQTVDGDCEVRAGWLDRAYTDLADDPRRAVAFGRRRERYPGRNAYHMVCDDEWDVATGAVGSCGGDALFRVMALGEVGGYDDALIAGEEPDLCLRLRQRGWTIWSNGCEMTWHDVAIDRLGQWWQRSKRTGFAIAELVRMHGEQADPSWRKLLRSATAWSAVVLAAVVATALLIIGQRPLTGTVAFALLALLALQLVRLAVRQHRRVGGRRRDALAWSGLMMIAKLAQAQGWLLFHARRRSRRRTMLIEYKRPDATLPEQSVGTG